MHLSTPFFIVVITAIIVVKHSVLISVSVCLCLSLVSCCSPSAEQLLCNYNFCYLSLWVCMNLFCVCVCVHLSPSTNQSKLRQPFGLCVMWSVKAAVSVCGQKEFVND